MALKKQPDAVEPRSYQLKVTLKDIQPPIWRRFVVRDDVTLAKLHESLQGIMGWTNSHLHQFVMGDMSYGESDPEFHRPRLDERAVQLRQLLSKPADRLVYEYDFGDSWEHEVLLEQVLPHEPGARYPIILAGERACPPEDCGGVEGYRNLLEALAEPNHPEHHELLAWVGGKFDPGAFDAEKLNGDRGGGRIQPVTTRPLSPGGRTKRAIKRARSDTPSGG